MSLGLTRRVPGSAGGSGADASLGLTRRAGGAAGGSGEASEAGAIGPRVTPVVVEGIRAGVGTGGGGASDVLVL